MRYDKDKELNETWYW